MPVSPRYANDDSRAVVQSGRTTLHPRTRRRSTAGIPNMSGQSSVRDNDHQCHTGSKKLQEGFADS